MNQGLVIQLLFVVILLLLVASGDTVSLASGASQTGFGRTGTVDWQTSIKTSGFTAVSGEGYFVIQLQCCFYNELTCRTIRW